MKAAHRLFALVTLAGLASVAVLVACSSDDSGGGSGLDVGELGTCQTSYPGDAGKYPLAALPSGQACGGPSSCTLAVDTCPADLASANGGVNLTEYECDCLDGGWSCYAAVKVDTTCEEAGSAEDAGGASGDASGDAATVGASTDGGGAGDASDASEPDADAAAGNDDASVDSGAGDAGDAEADANDAG